MNWYPLLLLLLLVPAQGSEQAACVVPKGPPCLTMSELRERLDQGHCTFEEGACIVLQWDEYRGDTIIQAAEIIVSPSCKKPETAVELEQKGRTYLESLQSIPIEITVTRKDCVAKGVVDVKITKSEKADAK